MIAKAAPGTPVLVTGATGFLGSRLAALLAKRGLQVRALVRPSSDLSRLAGLGLELVRGELADPASLAAAVAGRRHVFHCAALVADWGSKGEFTRANVEGTRNLVEACLAARVERLVHTSSLSVLGLPRDGRVVDEATPVASRPEELDRYSESKIAAERMVLEAVARGLPACIVRPGAIWGPGERKQLPRIERLLRLRLLPLIDGGKNHVALSHADNVAEGMLLCALCPDVAGEVFHLTDGEDLTAREVLCGLARAYGLPPPRVSLPFRPLLALGALSERAGRALGLGAAPPITGYAVRVLASDCRYDIGKARRQLGYVPHVSFESGLQQLLVNRGG
jgi:2-alkyl-3-oxoalkanoate reductase